MPPELANAEPCPDALAYIWMWFCEVFNGERLQYAEIQAWSNLTKRSLSAFEVDLLRSLERTFFKVKNNG
jgi:hypothetical protein